MPAPIPVAHLRRKPRKSSELKTGIQPIAVFNSVCAKLHHSETAKTLFGIKRDSKKNKIPTEITFIFLSLTQAILLIKRLV